MLGFQRRDLALCSICHVCWLAVVYLGLGDSSCLTSYCAKRMLIVPTCHRHGEDYWDVQSADQGARTWP